MNDIGPEAKSLFAAARKAEGLPGPKRARIKQAVLLQAATLGAATTVAGGAVAMSMAAKVTLVTVTAAVLGGGSVSVWAWKKHEEAVSSTRALPTHAHARSVSAKSPVLSQRPNLQEPALAPVPVRMPAAVPAPVAPQRRVAKPAVVNERPIVEAVVPVAAEPNHGIPARAETREEPARALAPVAAQAWEPAYADARRAAANPAPVTGAPVMAVSKVTGPAPVSLDSELNLLRQAQEDLRLGLPARALNRLADFERRFPKSKLDQERQAIEAIASCQVRPGPASLARAHRFLQKTPLSPLAARVRSACLQDDDKSFNETSPRREP